MITKRLLSSADFTSLYECFLEAFSDYQVDMQISQEQFEQRLVRDGVRLDISAGAFDGNKLVGFYLNASGMWLEKHTAYDAGTGVMPAYRRQGVAKELFAFLVPLLKEASAAQYLLEVLTANEPAVSLYRRLGFTETRRLAVFRRSEPVRTSREPVVVRRVDQPDWELFKSFWDGYPSWQNSIDAVERIASDRVVLCAYVDARCVGYGVVFKPAASLMQLAVAPAYRRKGIASTILSVLQSEFSESLKVNNIDEQLNGTIAFFEANDFKLVLEQYEMVYDLTR
ncbi:MAG TPA: GNAT family N-acetyltransferase [Pyrinomonadaceae bacterium]|nr:GNAT family N-acetyltransferase [Pyrinomonadaceae bacterium]